MSLAMLRITVHARQSGRRAVLYLCGGMLVIHRLVWLRMRGWPAIRLLWRSPSGASPFSTIIDEHWNACRTGTGEAGHLARARKSAAWPGLCDQGTFSAASHASHPGILESCTMDGRDGKIWPIQCRLPFLSNDILRILCRIFIFRGR